MADADHFVFESCIRSFHIYNSLWTSEDYNGSLKCTRESGNVFDPYAVAVVNSRGTTLGHVPCSVSAVLSMVLLRNNTDSTCNVIGNPRYSADLPQRRLELPCHYTFSGTYAKIQKASKLLQEAPSSTPATSSVRVDSWQSTIKKRKTGTDTSFDTRKSIVQLWVEQYSQKLFLQEKEQLLKGEVLSDHHIYTSQAILKNQFPGVSGLNSTLFQQRKSSKLKVSNGLQIVHCCKNHWIPVSNMKCEEVTIEVFDSLYSDISEETNEVLQGLFHFSHFQMMSFQKQTGNMDCGLFTIATSTAILFGKNPSSICFQQCRMRIHLQTCIEQGSFTLFP